MAETKEAIALSNTVISQYQGTFNIYPCPADASLPAADPLFGVSQCANPALVNPGDCTAGGGLCLTQGVALPTPILIGSIPMNTIRATLGDFVNFADEDFVDAWGNRIMYAVSLDLTNAATYRFYNGAISAVDEFGNPTAGVDDDAHYVVYSNGRDNRGAFDRFGVRNFACGTVADSTDFENCDGDSTFVQAKGYYLSRAAADYYDDHIFFGKKVNEALWVYEPNMTDVRTTITGNVGVGTNTPGTKLDIQNGGVAELEADNDVFARQICNAAGTECFDIEAITGAGLIRCPTSGDVMNGLSLQPNDRFLDLTNCITPAFAPLKPNQMCPGSEWIRGITTDGDIICTTP
ncbi:MAG: hypothetical protein R3E13_08385 [Alphaproteobacteria bacterium]